MKIRLFKPKIPSQWKLSIHRLTFAWKTITFITTSHRPADEDVPAIPAWKAELLQLHREISTPAKRNKQNENLELVIWDSNFSGTQIDTMTHILPVIHNLVHDILLFDLWYWKKENKKAFTGFVDKYLISNLWALTDGATTFRESEFESPSPPMYRSALNDLF